MIRISVVIPTYRRADLLERCLRAVTVQILDPAEYEILVVDDANTVETRRQVQRWAEWAPLSIRYLGVTGPHGPAAARNLGWRAARGQIVAFTDDDCVPDRDWLVEGLAAFDEGIAAVTGRVIVPLGEAPTDYERDAAGLEQAEFVTANCFCKKDVLEQLDGFDERFAAAWREDSDLQFKLLRSGRVIVRAEQARVVHPVRPARWGVSLGQQRKSQFDALLYKKHPSLYRRKVGSTPPLGYYAMVVLVVSAAVAGLSGYQTLASGSFLAWAVLCIRFCAKRLNGTSRAPAHVVEMIVTSLMIPPLSIYWRLRGAWRFKVLFA